MLLQYAFLGVTTCNNIPRSSGIFGRQGPTCAAQSYVTKNFLVQNGFDILTEKHGITGKETGKFFLFVDLNNHLRII